MFCRNKTVIREERCDDYRHTQRKIFQPGIRQKIDKKGSILDSNGADKNKSFG
jgi:hypothetical protein